MSKDNVIKLGDVSGKSCHWTVEDMLKEILELMKSDNKYNKKAIVMFLDDSGGNYVTNYMSAGMIRKHEMIPLIEYIKKDIMG